VSLIKDLGAYEKNGLISRRSPETLFHYLGYEFPRIISGHGPFRDLAQKNTTTLGVLLVIFLLPAPHNNMFKSQDKWS
jgi:hypothetical protein